MDRTKSEFQIDTALRFQAIVIHPVERGTSPYSGEEWESVFRHS